MSNKLNPRQERFCQEYIIDLNATQAAIRAGYSEKAASQVSSRLMANAKIAARVEEMQAERSQRTEITADYVLSGLKEVAERCLQKKPVMEFDYQSKQMRQKIDPDTGEGVWEFDSHGANKAFELLGKHVGVFEKDNNQKKQVIKVGISDE